MPHRVHHTDAIVLSSRPVGESDREYRLLTRGYGLLRARARAVRLTRSKLRYILQPFSIVHADLVRGKAGWRVTSASLAEEFPFARRGKHVRVALAGGFRLVARLVHPEEPVPELFEDVRDFLSVLSVCSKENVLRYELVFAVRTLHRLGYWGAREIDPGVFNGKLSDISLALLERHRNHLVRSINDALRQSHL